MNRLTKKVLSIVCAIAMVVTSMTGLKLTSVIADTTTSVIKTDDAARTDLLAEVANADYNFALGKDATVSLLTTGDGGTNLASITDGTFTTTNNTNTIIMIGKGSKDNAWVQVDLGNAYDTSKIDRIAVQYKTTNSGPKNGYYISYSLNGIDYVTVATVGAIAGSNNQIYLDKISLTDAQAEAIPYARYIRVTSTTDTSAYGLQIKGMAVLTDGTTKVSEVDYEEVEMLDDVASLAVTSSDFNQLEYSFEAAPNDDGTYLYKVYINGIVYEEAAVPGKEYIVNNLAAGEYAVKVVATTDSLSASGITESVTVNDTKSLLTSDRNLAIGKTAKASSIRDNDVEVNITDGKLNSQFRTVTSDTNSTIVIDLGQNYRLDAIERTVGLYLANRYPTAYTIDYSINGTDFETVATGVGSSDVQTVVIDPSECTLPAVRYVRFSFSAPVTANYGFQMYELGVIAKEGADLTPVEIATVENPAAFEVAVTDYNTVEATITAAEGQEDYKYNIYIDGVAVMTGVDAGTYEIKDIEAGDREFTVKSIVDGITSEGISVTKTVKNAFTYNYETLANSNVEAGKVIDETKDADGVTYNNYSLFKKASATASTEENANLVPGNVLDGNNATRWSTLAGIDPQWIIVDLGHTYKINVIDIVWQNSSAKDYDIEFSIDGDEYTKVGMVTSAAAGSRYDNIVLTEEVEARYVRIYGTARTGVYGYSIWDMGIYGPDVEDTTPANVAGLAVTAGIATWQASAYATLYNLYCDGEFIGNTTELTYDFSDIFTSNGEYEVGVQAVNDDGKTSNITTVTVQYDEEETTTPVPEVKFGWEIQYPDGNGFVSTDFEMPGFTIENIPAGTEKWVCGARLQNIPVEAGKTYTVSFNVTSTVNKVVPVELTNGTAAYINVNATPEGAEYSQQFTAAGNTIKLYMPLGVDPVADDSIDEAYSITVSNVQVVEYVEGETPEETTTPEPAVETYEISVDGTVVATVEDGAIYTVPTDSANGYLSGDVAYRAGTEVTVNEDMAFTTIGDVTVTAAHGAGIRYVDISGIRFQATVDADEAVLDSAALTTGMIITAEDIYKKHDSVLTLDVIGDVDGDEKSDYAALNIVNNGWYEGQTGTYCGSIVNINEANYIRPFIAVAYATITYTDGTSTTVYSNMTGVRSIKGVAAAVQAAGYPGIDSAYHATIDAFAAAK